MFSIPKTLNNTMQEKYFIINLTNQIYLILRCSQQKLDNYLNYGIKLITNNHNSIVIDRLSDWLVFHSIRFRAEKIPTKNPFKKFSSKIHSNCLNKSAIDSHMFISDNEMEELVSSLEDGKGDMLWDLAREGMSNDMYN